tara:strand:+ start:2976 stop:4502 length:1527 start_codon:yes stop_codon:yes gene_type:complete
MRLVTTSNTNTNEVSNINNFKIALDDASEATRIRAGEVLATDYTEGFANQFGAFDIQADDRKVNLDLDFSEEGVVGVSGEVVDDIVTEFNSVIHNKLGANLMQMGHDIKLRGCLNPACETNLSKERIWEMFKKYGLVSKVKTDGKFYSTEKVKNQDYRIKGEYLVDVSKREKFMNLEGRWKTVYGVLRSIAIKDLRTKHNGFIPDAIITDRIATLKNGFKSYLVRFNTNYEMIADQISDDNEMHIDNKTGMPLPEEMRDTRSSNQSLCCPYCTSTEVIIDKMSDSLRHECVREGDTGDGAINKTYRLYKLKGYQKTKGEGDQVKIMDVPAREIDEDTFYNMRNEFIDAPQFIDSKSKKQRQAEFYNKFELYKQEDGSYKLYREWIMPTIDDLHVTEKEKFEWSLNKAKYVNENGEQITFADCTSEDMVILLNQSTGQMEAEFAARMKAHSWYKNELRQEARMEKMRWREDLGRIKATKVDMDLSEATIGISESYENDSVFADVAGIVM